MKRFLSVLIMLFVCSIQASAWAMYAPPEGTFFFTAEGQNHESRFFYDEYTGVTHVNAPAFDFITNPGELPIFNVGFSFFIKWDPKIGYSDFTIKNLSQDEQGFSFYMAGPIQTVSGTNRIASSMSAEVAGGRFSACQSTFLADSPSIYTPGDTTGLTYLSYFDVSLSGNGESVINENGPSGDWAFMLVKLSGSLSSGATLTLKGGSEIVPTHVPAALWLLGSGLGLLAGFKKRKLKK